jgi:hypothetical protein
MYNNCTEIKFYPSQNSKIAFSSALMLENPAAAAWSP